MPRPTAAALKRLDRGAPYSAAGEAGVSGVDLVPDDTRSVSAAATALVPDPRNGSSTSSPRYVHSSIDRRVSDRTIYPARPGRRTRNGGAALVVEIRSRRVESMVKLPLPCAHGSREVLIIDRDTRSVELHGADGRIDPVHSDVLGCTSTTVDGPAVQVHWDGGAAVIPDPP